MYLNYLQNQSKTFQLYYNSLAVKSQSKISLETKLLSQINFIFEKKFKHDLKPTQNLPYHHQL